MDQVNIQTYNCMLHQPNSVYNPDEQVLYAIHMKAPDLKAPNPNYEQSSVRHSSSFFKRLFFFYCHDWDDPVHIKYKYQEYSLHPGHTRMIGAWFREKPLKPVSCILYAEVGDKPVPISGLKVLSKNRLINFSKEVWDKGILKNQDILKFQKKTDTHYNLAEQVWRHLTNNIYRVTFGDRNLIIFPDDRDMKKYDEVITLNLNNYSGFRECVRDLFERVKNERQSLAS
tara:strand:+ start:3876 stop:4559 length:684 start_codon:yes stop_codon:yes gene_type:complete